MATRFNITDGPSKWDLMLALFDGDGPHRRPCKFSFRESENRQEITSLLQIEDVRRDGGDGELWIMTGFTVDPDVPNQSFYANFSTRDRKGWVQF